MKSIKNTIEIIKNSKSSKFIKNIEKKDKKYASTEKINRNTNNDTKVYYSTDIKNNKNNENNYKKKINYKPIKVKEEYDIIDNKYNFNIFSTKSKLGIKKNSYLTSSMKKNKNTSADKSQLSNLVPPKKLFKNKSILPPLQKKYN